MKKNNVKKGIFTALLLASPFVTAGTQYPAADFQPKVVYQDKNYQHEGGSSSSSASTSFGEKAKADASYPAATFQPEVVYHDADYKHKAGSSSAKSIPLATWTEAVDSAVEEKYADEAEATDEASSESPLFAVVVLAVAAFLFSRKSKGSAKTKSTGSAAAGRAAASASAGGLTGVARYLNEKSPKLTGVAKYLEENQSAPKSGVAKYVAKKVVAAKKAAAEKTTGVEKYIRNRG